MTPSPRPTRGPRQRRLQSARDPAWVLGAVVDATALRASMFAGAAVVRTALVRSWQSQFAAAVFEGAGPGEAARPPPFSWAGSRRSYPAWLPRRRPRARRPGQTS